MENEKKYPIKLPEEMPFKEKRLCPGIIEGFNSYDFKNLDNQMPKMLNDNIYIIENNSEGELPIG